MTELRSESRCLHSGSAVGYLNCGVAHFDWAEYEQAIANFTEAIRCDPNLAEAYVNRGVVHYTLGDREQALADLTRALDLDPTLIAAYLNRMEIYHELGDNERALADYEEYRRASRSLWERMCEETFSPPCCPEVKRPTWTGALLDVAYGAEDLWDYYCDGRVDSEEQPPPLAEFAVLMAMTGLRILRWLYTDGPVAEAVNRGRRVINELEREVEHELSGLLDDTP